MKMTLMGTGTSHGVPVIGCRCAVCTSTDERDRRYRCSAYVTHGGSSLVIDTGPEFRLQALRHCVNSLDAVLITHSHADHLNGLDDLRIYSHSRAVDPSHPEQAAHETEGRGLPIYANCNTIRDIKNRFDYIFMPVREGGGKPKLNLVDAKDFSPARPITVGGMQILPVPLLHGTLNDLGWLITCTHGDGTRHSIAYLLDANCIPQSSIDLVRKNAGTLEHLVIDGLREEKHSTHFSFEEALAAAQELGPRHTWITHLTHNKSHVQVQEFLVQLVRQKFTEPDGTCRAGGSVAPAYDGLVIEA